MYKNLQKKTNWLMISEHAQYFAAATSGRNFSNTDYNSFFATFCHIFLTVTRLSWLNARLTQTSL